MRPVMFNRGVVTLYVLVIIMLAISAVASNVTVSISGVNHEIRSFDNKGIVYISLSELAGLTGGNLDWTIVGHQIDYVLEDNHFTFVIGSPFIKRNGSVFNMTYNADLKDGQLYLPAQTFLQFFDQVSPKKISWQKESRTVRVESDYFNVNDIALSPKANGLLIEIFLSGEVSYDVFVTEGNWINVSIRNGRLNRARIESRRDSRYMYELKTHQENETGQISIQLKRSVENWHHKFQNDPPRIQISIPDADFEMTSPDTTPRVGPDDKIDVIVIDPGHGGDHYGAVGPGGTREKDVALDIAKELAKLIRKEKLFKVVMTRDRDAQVTLEERAEIANRHACDLFISIHANSSIKKNIRGWNVFLLAPAKNDSARAVAQFENSAFFRDQMSFDESEDSDSLMTSRDPVLNILNEMIMTEFQAESQELAMMVDREFRRKLDIPARGVDQAGFFVLNMVFAPSVLVETGFISNKDEERLLKGSPFQKTVAQSLYDAIKRFKAKYESN